MSVCAVVIGAVSYFSLHGASWTLVWGAVIGVVLWAIIAELFPRNRQRLPLLLAALLVLALYTATTHREAGEFERATPLQKEQIEEAGAER